MNAEELIRHSATVLRSFTKKVIVLFADQENTDSPAPSRKDKVADTAHCFSDVKVIDDIVVINNLKNRKRAQTLRDCLKDAPWR